MSRWSGFGLTDSSEPGGLTERSFAQTAHPLKMSANPSLCSESLEELDRSGESDKHAVQAAIKQKVVNFMSTKQVAREILRCTEAHQAFFSCGSALRPNAECGNLYNRSRAVDQIQDFWSHAWLGNSWGKFLTLLVMYNGPAALFVGCVCASMGVALFLLGMLPGSNRGYPDDVLFGTAGFSLWGLPFGVVGVFLTLALFRSSKRVFLDRICISDDPALKMAAIVSLPGLLQNSDSMLVLWDPNWPSRLWCVFELAAFLSLNKGAPRVCPTIMGPCSIAVFFMVACVMSPVTFSPLQDYDLTMVISCVAVLGASTACPAIRVFGAYYRAVEDMEKTLRTLRIMDTSCSCCASGHVGQSFCDKELICACITEWFGSTEAFEHYIQTDVTDVLVHQLQWGTFRYKWSCAVAAPALWACLDIASFPYQREDLKTTFVWLGAGLTLTFMAIPGLSSWCKFLTYTFRHGASCRHEVMRTSLVILCALPLLAYVVGAVLLWPVVRYDAPAYVQLPFFPSLMLPFVLLQCRVPRAPDFQLNRARSVLPTETVSPVPADETETVSPEPAGEEVPSQETRKKQVLGL